LENVEWLPLEATGVKMERRAPGTVVVNWVTLVRQVLGFKTSSPLNSVIKHVNMYARTFHGETPDGGTLEDCGSQIGKYSRDEE
jgi:hypothetical protein